MRRTKTRARTHTRGIGVLQVGLSNLMLSILFLWESKVNRTTGRIIAVRSVHTSHAKHGGLVINLRWYFVFVSYYELLRSYIHGLISTGYKYNNPKPTNSLVTRVPITQIWLGQKCVYQFLVTRFELEVLSISPVTTTVHCNQKENNMSKAQ